MPLAIFVSPTRSDLLTSMIVECVFVCKMIELEPQAKGTCQVFDVTWKLFSDDGGVYWRKCCNIMYIWAYFLSIYLL